MNYKEYKIKYDKWFLDRMCDDQWEIEPPVAPDEVKYSGKAIPSAIYHKISKRSSSVKVETYGDIIKRELFNNISNQLFGQDARSKRYSQMIQQERDQEREEEAQERYRDELWDSPAPQSRYLPSGAYYGSI